MAELFFSTKFNGITFVRSVDEVEYSVAPFGLDDESTDGIDQLQEFLDGLTAGLQALNGYLPKPFPRKPLTAEEVASAMTEVIESGRIKLDGSD